MDFCEIMPKISIKSTLIAPCGLNCALCYAYVREKNPCPGCFGSDEKKPDSCLRCYIKNCGKRGKHKYCFGCNEFPCIYMKRLNKRYTTKYGANPIHNLIYIHEDGIRKFIRQEKEKWACKKCGEIICMHRETCDYCGYKWR